MRRHDFFKLMGTVKESLAQDYQRIRSRSRDDPGTAGDQVEEDWAKILRNWLPATYPVVTKGRILFHDGSSSPQVDVLVLKPSYPLGMRNEKYIFSGGVIAVFECKLTLRKEQLREAFRAAHEIKRKSPIRLGTPYEELNCVPFFGLLAHSHSLRKGRASWTLYDAVEEYQNEFAEHPRELLDIICVADAATVPLGKHVLIGSDLDKDELEALAEFNVPAGVSTMHVIHEEENRKGAPDDTGAILAGLIHELTFRMAFEDSSIRHWAEHLSALGFYGGIGRPLCWTPSVLSAPVRAKMKARRWTKDRWSYWNRSLP